MSITDKLLKLYRVDEQLHSLRSRLDGAERYYNAQNRKLKELETLRTQTHDEMMHASATGSNFEMEAKTIEERMDTLRERMSSSKTNKEYTAFVTELNTIKIDKDEAESKALELMSESDELQTQLTDLGTQKTERAKVCKIARKDFEERKAAIADRLAELEEERNVAKAEIPDYAYSVYSTQLDWNDGEAMAVVHENDRRNMEYACGSCHMTIPIERLSKLLGCGEMTICPSCQRLLYVDAELREVFDKKLAKS